MTMTAQLPTTTESEYVTPSVRVRKPEPMPTNVSLSPSELAWVRTLPRGRTVLKDALLQPVPVTEWLASVETALMISRVSSGYLASRSARRRAAEGPALELLRSTCIDICLEKAREIVAVTSAHVAQVETLVRTYIHAQGARANLPTTCKWTIRLRPDLLASLNATAASLGMSRALLIRCLIGSHVEGARDAGFPLPGDPLTTAMFTRHQSLLAIRDGLLGMREGLLAMKAAQSLETFETTPQLVA